MRLVERARRGRAERALERQLAYQIDKARRLDGPARERIDRALADRARSLRALLGRFRPIGDGDRLLEVGSGAHGLVFFLGLARGVGVDPLAAAYRALFPGWQSRAPTVAAVGEALPFSDGAFDAVISDNVVDHAEDPARIVAEMARVLAPGGLLYFTVNVHHPLWWAASRAYGLARALGIPLEVGPFADHTVHLTPEAARRLFRGLPLRIEQVAVDEGRARLDAARKPARHAGDWLKRFFFKNAQLEVIARRLPRGPA